MWVNDKKVIESKCWQKTAGAEVTLEAGYHTIDILFADDGWHDTLVFLYSGPDTEGNLRIVPGHVMHPSCPGPDDFLTKAMDCKVRHRHGRAAPPTSAAPLPRCACNRACPPWFRLSWCRCAGVAHRRASNAPEGRPATGTCAPIKIAASTTA